MSKNWKVRALWVAFVCVLAWGCTQASNGPGPAGSQCPDDGGTPTKTGAGCVVTGSSTGGTSASSTGGSTSSTSSTGGSTSSTSSTGGSTSSTSSSSSGGGTCTSNVADSQSDVPQ